MCACAAFLCGSPVHALLGKVIYVQTLDKSSSGSADVLEQDLDSGTSEVLISNTDLHRDFKSSIGSLAVSPDASRLVLGESVLEKIENSGASDVIGLKLWLWDRSTKAFRLIVKDPESYEVFWSHSGQYILIIGAYGSRFRVYDTASQKLSDYKMPGAISALSWSAGGTGVICAIPEKKPESTVHFQPLATGDRRRLFRWSKEITSIAESPDGSQYAIYDESGVYLVSGDTKNVRKLSLPVKGASTTADLLYNPKCSKVAVLVSTGLGDQEPLVNVDEFLWSVDAASGEGAHLATWHESYQAISPEKGEVVTRSLVDWLSDGKSLIISGNVTWGGTGQADNRNDRFRLWVHDITKPDADPKLIFDSGPGVPCISWWPANR
jgi:hypothetical protein